LTLLNDTLCETPIFLTIKLTHIR